MKKIFFSLILFFIFSSFLPAQGTYIELITAYNKESYNDYLIATSGKTNSLLEYKADYLFKEGLKANLEIRNFEINLSALFTLPFKCGDMYDSDWRASGIKTNYSHSDLYAGLGCDLILGLKYRFEIPAGNIDIFISPALVLSNSFISLKAKNTIGWCGDITHTHLDRHYSWDSPYAKKVKKYGINYCNNMTSIFCGLEASLKYKNFFSSAGALVSPFTYILAVDHHLNKEEGNWYQMIQKSSFAVWDFYASLGWSVNDKHSILLGADFSFCPEIPGDFYYGYFMTENIIADESSRFSFSKLAITISWRIAL